MLGRVERKTPFTLREKKKAFSGGDAAPPTLFPASLSPRVTIAQPCWCVSCAPEATPRVESAPPARARAIGIGRQRFFHSIHPLLPPQTKFETKSNRVKGLSFHPKRCVRWWEVAGGHDRRAEGSANRNQKIKRARRSPSPRPQAPPPHTTHQAHTHTPSFSQALDPGVAAQRRDSGETKNFGERMMRFWLQGGNHKNAPHAPTDRTSRWRAMLPPLRALRARGWAGRVAGTGEKKRSRAH